MRARYLAFTAATTLVLSISAIGASGLAPGVSSTPVGDHASPAGVAPGPDGAIWFTDNVRGTIGRLVPCASGPCTFTSTQLPGKPGTSVRPTNIVAGPDGAMWFIDFGTGFLGRIETCPGGSCRITVSQLAARGPGTQAYVPAGIATGSDGAMWVTTTGESIDRFEACSKDNCKVTETTTPGSSPTSIVAGPDNAIWFGTTRGIGRLTPCAGGGCPVTTTPIGADDPKISEDPSSIVVGPDKAIWFTEAARNKIGRLVPCATGNCPVTETQVPVDTVNRGGSSNDPSGLALGTDGKLWFAEFPTGRIARIDACATGGCKIYETASMPGVGPGKVAPGPDSAMWFTEDIHGAIDRIALNAPLTLFAPPGVKLAGSKVRIKSGKGTLKATCQGGPHDTCAVTAKVLAGTKQIGTAKGTIIGGRKGTIKIALNAAGRKALAHHQSQKAELAGTVKSRQGKAALKTSLTLTG